MYHIRIQSMALSPKNHCQKPFISASPLQFQARFVHLTTAHTEKREVGLNCVYFQRHLLPQNRNHNLSLQPTYMYLKAGKRLVKQLRLIFSKGC